MCEISEEQSNYALEHLEQVGESIEKGDILLHESAAIPSDDPADIVGGLDYSLEKFFEQYPMEFASVVTSNTDKRSWSQDNFIFKVRYWYAGTDKRNSREFCRKMRAADKVYRKEDIIKAGKQSVNPGFGPKGRDNYSIWLYKGGNYCHHFWMRKIYLKSNGKEISVNQVRKLVGYLTGGTLIKGLPKTIMAKVKIPGTNAYVYKRIPNPIATPSLKYPGILKPSYVIKSPVSVGVNIRGIGKINYTPQKRIRTMDLLVPVNDKRVAMRPIDMTNGASLTEGRSGRSSSAIRSRRSTASYNIGGGGSNIGIRGKIKFSLGSIKV